MSFDVERIRKDFPIFEREVNGHPLVYLDSANTSQKPVQVLDVMRAHQERYNGNVSRSVHTLGTESTEAYEGARARIATFIGAASPDEVVFTKNSTEAINLVAHSLGQMLRLGPGDEVVISEMEHHSNLVPWQLLCERTGATLRWFGITDEGRLDESALDDLVSERTKIVSLVHMSNVLGTINDVSGIAARARSVGALVMLDCSQSVPHLPLDVSSLGADLIAFTGHKMLGPTGIGVLWGRLDLLAQMPPFLAGGSMIETVTMGGTTFAAPPARFEAGTPPITEAIGLGAAVDYLTGLGMEAIHQHEQDITRYALDALTSVPGVRIFGPETVEGRGGTVSFGVDGVHPHDVGQVLDALGVEVRVGHHCAKPVCSRFSVPAMTRASFYLYTTTAEIDALARGLDQVRKVFG
ncbi:putative cysteine desulfurase [Actinoplanes lobatus]|uniref:cysteine desulfurase n=1 Tax=Actinoplanes lobatus TaxID=113568 RepID=A0A7W7MGN6_9ACTN|nr:cysteine desulfurase [Actinoplanes lobatus]MBB4749584.1 cysteine desulfurase/selenocysteine lyase [Actinoplanes lobatus]GGN78199.1 putative cysteine desulfurase [Actinoplanes lobatus]GIE38323.1 putative cysteine desulfurase [Actinoplanes lobatus]